jgi:predicted negative regulator of RcsB-dependent stress response
LLAHGWWFSPSPASSTTKTGRHDIAEILLKVALNTKKSNQIRQLMNLKVEGLLLDTKPTDGSSAY